MTQEQLIESIKTLYDQLVRLQRTDPVMRQVFIRVSRLLDTLRREGIKEPVKQ